MFEKEKGIILEELAKDRSDAGWLAGRFRSRALWGDASRGLAVLGTEESIANMDPAAVERFYEEYYRPAGMTIVLMGDFDLAEARAEIERLYGGDDRPPVPLPARPAFPDGRRIERRAVPGLGKVEVRVWLPLPPLAPDDFATARLVENVLSSGESTALARAAEAAGVSALGASASIEAGDPWSLLTLAVDLPEGTDPAPVIPAVLAHVAAFAEHGPDAAHLESARREVVAGEISLREKMHYWGFMRSDVLGSAEPRVAVTLAEEAAERTAEDCAALLRPALADGRVLVTVAGAAEDGSEELAARPGPDDASWWPEDTGEPGPAAPPAPPVTEETTVERLVLENGVTLVVHSSPDARTFATQVLLRDRARVEEALGVPAGTSDVVHRAMGLGTDSLTEDALRGRLAGLGASLKTTDSDFIPYDDYYFSPEYSYLRLETIDVHALPALELLAEVMYSPRLTTESWEKARAAAVARAGKSGSAPRDVAEEEYWRLLGAPSLAGVYGSAEELAAVPLEAGRRVHEALVSPERTIVAISGSLPADTLVAAATRLWGGRPAGPALDLPPAPRTPAEGGGRAEESTGQEQSWIWVGTPVPGADGGAPEDEAALRLATSVLSDRLADRLREREGLAYSIGASYRSVPPRNVRLGAGTRPDNLPRMEEGMLEVAASLVSEPPTEREITAARNRSEGRTRMRRLSRIGQAYALAMAELRGRDPGDLDAIARELQAVGPEDVVRAARAHLAFDDPVTAVAR
jgi:zinc protease